MNKAKKTKKDLFSRLKSVISDFFSDETKKGSKSPIKKKKGFRKTKKQSSQFSSGIIEKVAKTQENHVSQVVAVNSEEKIPKMRQDVQMPAPWSKVTKYKKIKKDNYYQYL